MHRRPIPEPTICGHRSAPTLATTPRGAPPLIEVTMIQHAVGTSCQHQGRGPRTLDGRGRLCNSSTGGQPEESSRSPFSMQKQIQAMRAYHPLCTSPRDAPNDKSIWRTRGRPSIHQDPRENTTAGTSTDQGNDGSHEELEISPGPSPPWTQPLPRGRFQ